MSKMALARKAVENSPISENGDFFFLPNFSTSPLSKNPYPAKGQTTSANPVLEQSLPGSQRVKVSHETEDPNEYSREKKIRQGQTYA
jgi:hypothetical protein